MKKREIFKVEGDTITRVRRHCPKCGDGVFLAEHNNRLSCGKCGYTEFKGGKSEKPQKPVKSEEQPPQKKDDQQSPSEHVGSEPEEKAEDGGSQPPVATDVPAEKTEEQH